MFTIKLKPPPLPVLLHLIQHPIIEVDVTEKEEGEEDLEDTEEEEEQEKEKKEDSVVRVRWREGVHGDT